jgi:hypothetical protein
MSSSRAITPPPSLSFQSVLVFQDSKRRQLDEISDPDPNWPAPQFDNRRKKAALGSGNQGIRHSEFSDPDLPVSEARC